MTVITQDSKSGVFMIVNLLGFDTCLTKKLYLGLCQGFPTLEMLVPINTESARGI